MRPVAVTKHRSTNGRPSGVAAVRRFNRFYTRLVGALDEGHLHSQCKLAEVRVLYEIARRSTPLAAEIGRDLKLDAGYLSRMLRNFEQRGWLARTPSAADGRQSHLHLTANGGAAFADLDGRARADVAALLARLTARDERRLLEAMRTIEAVLGGYSPTHLAPKAAYHLRPHRPGDMGWVVLRHGVLYALEYGWDERFEALVARIAADFIEHFDPERERCWIAEREGENVGSVFVVKHPEREGVAKLRLLLVEPSARGLGIGRRLVDECERFAGEAGYRVLTLWTNSVLLSARRIYEAAGYRLVAEERHASFGPDLVGQRWELVL